MTLNTMSHQIRSPQEACVQSGGSSGKAGNEMTLGIEISSNDHGGLQQLELRYFMQPSEDARAVLT
jgi:hypothetical protein